MHAKYFELKIHLLNKLLGWSILSITFFPVLTSAADLTIEQFQAQQVQQKQAAYEIFRNEWDLFLARKIPQVPISISPADARKATEELLWRSGGLKKRFAEASQKNNFGFTFQRPIDDPLRQASFHRTYNSIFIDVQNVSANRWLIRFVHEVSHSLDSELYRSLNIYGNKDLVKELADLGQSNTPLSELTSAQRIQLDTWLMAGLSRGFLGEYRAWLATLILYEEGLRDGTFIEWDWLEQIRNSKPKNVALRDHLLRVLSPAWTNPTDGVFQYPFIQQALRELREKIDADPRMVPLGNLGNILQLN